MHYAQGVDPRLTNSRAAHYQAISLALLAAGRFTTALLLKRIKARYILLVSAALTVILLAIGAALPHRARLYLVIVQFYTHACFDPVVESLGLRGLGKHTKKGASLLVMCVASVAIFTPIFGAIDDKYGVDSALILTTCASGVVRLLAWYYE